MSRLIFLSAFMFSFGMFAHHSHGHHYGEAIHTASAKVMHKGDFIDFAFSFEAGCYSEREISRARVIDNVERFSHWLEEQQAHYGADALTHKIDLINVWRREANVYYGVSLCDNTYNASQQVTVRLHKINGETHLEADLIHKLFADMQVAVAPLNNIENVESQAGTIVSIHSVSKGVNEETADALRIAAKAKAKKRATADFAAFLGDDYHGRWHLHSVDFSSDDSRHGFEKNIELASALPGNQPGGSVLSVLKLDDISHSVHGNFHFHFEIVDMHTR